MLECLLIEDEEAIELQPPSPATGSTAETPDPPATSTSTTMTSVEAVPSGSHALSGFGAATALPQSTTSDAGPSTVIRDDDEYELRPSGAIHSPLDQQKLDNLNAIFPSISRDIIRNAVMTCNSLNTGVICICYFTIQ